MTETPCVDCGTAVTIDPPTDAGTHWRCGRCGRTATAQPVPSDDSAAGFLADRADWLRVEAIDRGPGSFDVGIIVDGTYYAQTPAERDEMVRYFAEWLARVLTTEGIRRRA